MEKKDNYVETMQQVLIDTLERLAYLFALPGRGEVPEPERDNITTVAVRFFGPYTGSFFLVFPVPLLTEIAQNMLGTDEPVSDKQAEDAAKECVNVSCGNILPVLFGSKAIFNIGSPEFVGMDSLKELWERTYLKTFIQVDDAFIYSGICLDQGMGV